VTIIFQYFSEQQRNQEFCLGVNSRSEFHHPDDVVVVHSAQSTETNQPSPAEKYPSYAPN